MFLNSSLSTLYFHWTYRSPNPNPPYHHSSYTNRASIRLRFLQFFSLDLKMEPTTSSETSANHIHTPCETQKTKKPKKHNPPPPPPNQILQNPKSFHNNPPPSYPDPDQSNPKKFHPIYFKIIHLQLVLPNDSLAQVSRLTLCTYFLCVVQNTSHDDTAVLIRRTAEGLFALAN